jgi:hypothetical protein
MSSGLQGHRLVDSVPWNRFLGSITWRTKTTWIQFVFFASILPISWISRVRFASIFLSSWINRLRFASICPIRRTSRFVSFRYRKWSQDRSFVPPSFLILLPLLYSISKFGRIQTCMDRCPCGQCSADCWGCIPPPPIWLLGGGTICCESPHVKGTVQ